MPEPAVLPLDRLGVLRGAGQAHHRAVPKWKFQLSTAVGDQLDRKIGPLRKLVQTPDAAFALR